MVVDSGTNASRRWTGVLGSKLTRVKVSSPQLFLGQEELWGWRKTWGLVDANSPNREASRAVR